VIEIKNLTKTFDQRLALDDVTLSVPQSAVYALVGSHGSGKSTLLKILATLVQPTRGDAFVAGSSVVSDKLRVRQFVGYLPDDFGVYPDQTCAEYVEFFAACYGVPSKERATLANDLLQLVDLHHRKDSPAERLTRTMRQRLGIARVLAHDPQVLLLDEPTLSLDPRARVEMRELIKELSGMGKTILFSATNLAEIQDVCTHAALIHEGKITRTGLLEDILTDVPPYRIISVKFLGDLNLASNMIRANSGVVNVQPVLDPHTIGEGLAGVALLKEVRVTFDGAYADASALLRSLMHSGVQVVTFAEEE
jgi:ABC-2 type transport system ATP-binding protein